MSTNHQLYTSPLISLTLLPSAPSILILKTTADASFNAQDLPMLEDLHHVLHDTIPTLTLNPTPRVLILTAQGTRRFLGAAKPEMLMTSSSDEGRHASNLGQENGFAFESGCGLGLVTIAAVNATALGGGLEMCLACDFAVASSRATFAQAEVLGGVVPGFGGSWRLSRCVGRGWERWMTFSGKAIDAEIAKERGLVLDVVDDGYVPKISATVSPACCGFEGVMARAVELAEGVCQAQEGAVREAKDILCQIETRSLSMEGAMRVENEAFAKRMGSKEIVDGMKGIIAHRDAM